MKHLNTIKKFAGLGILLALLGGCHHDDAPPSPQAKLNHGEDFAPDDQERSTYKLFAAQTAAGARADSTLYSEHFDGGALTSLGTQKLENILKDPHGTDPLVIYIATSDEHYDADRRTSVSNYLIDRGGLRTEQIKFEHGTDPNSAFPAADGLNALGTLNATSNTASGGGAPSAPAAAH